MFKRRHPLSTKDAKQLIAKVQSLPWFTRSLSKNVKIELAELQSGEKLYLFDGSPTLVELSDGALIPTLQAKDLLSNIVKVVVDMGAVPHITNGADIMVPGIREIRGACQINDIVVIVDEKHYKEIAVARALKSSVEVMQGEKRGKAFENLHYVGDKVWKAMQHLSATT
ncbi:MAG: RNA-binding protein [Candidatus Methanomethylicota archaeon]|uniref:RNA-binding protein n=1 Tax=Thermoproteota archaeon TaxID=2056631 RepID=A0A497EVJ5_9CREN|nr:MAG: RNA-binding protein [Candidatus Verstraetearchaeota archaeon]